MKSIIVNIGTVNPTKIAAVKEAFSLYKEFSNVKFIPIKVHSKVSDQPIKLKDTIKGARNRAKDSFKNCDYSIGLESGLFKIKEANTGYMDICIAVIYDGKRYYMGFGPALEFPKLVIRDILEKGMNSTDSFYHRGYTTKKNVGYEEGIIGVLSRNILSRKEYHKYSIIMALVQLINKRMYL